MSSYKAILIDDEEMARTLLSGMLAEFCPEITLVAECKDLPSGVKAIHKHKPDLVFLDIEMPGHSGLELLDFFDEEDLDFSIIFVTAYHQYAIQAFKLSAVDYLLKPIEIDDLQQAVARFIKQKSRQNFQVLKENLQLKSKKIALHNVSSINFVNLDEILFFRADGSYTEVYLESGRNSMTSKSLKHFENLLQEQPNFYRCHKSYIVNLNQVTAYVKSDGGSLMVGNHQIGVSPEKASVILERLS